MARGILLTLQRSSVRLIYGSEIGRHGAVRNTPDSHSEGPNFDYLQSKSAVLAEINRKISGSHGIEYENGCLWVVAPRSLAEVYQCIQKCLLPPSSVTHALMMEAASSSKTSVKFY
jgi:hypothetical protein